MDLLAAHAEPGLLAMPSGRFFGWVVGGTLPTALAADWLVTWSTEDDDVRRSPDAVRRATDV